MPRKPRFDLPDVPVHVVQRGNNRQPVFFDHTGRRAYLGWLGEAAERYGCAIHAYVLMTNHIHLLATPTTDGAISRMMQYVGRYYVPYVNRAHGRSGTLWEGRYKASLVDSDQYLLVCQRYIELNPVRAGLVPAPGDYRWSSYAANAQGIFDAIVRPHPTYEMLGPTAAARQHAYRQLFEDTLDPAGVDDMRRALQTGTPLGSKAFRARIEAALGHRVGLMRRGRPSVPR